MAYLLKSFNESGQARYYKHFNGKRPIFGAKSEAARLNKDLADTVESQLTHLGFSGFERVDETA